MKFYIDSAIPDDIEFVFQKVGASPLLTTNFGGITTNPNAMAKAGISTYAAMKSHLETLDEILYGTTHGPEIHVQLPCSSMTPSAAEMFIDDILSIGLLSKIVFKFPPNLGLLADVSVQYRKTPLRLNITGLTSIYDCLLFHSFDMVEYSSLIPGRMHAAGIEYGPHLSLYTDLTASAFMRGDVITGSMRTPTQVLEAAFARTLPTIGRKVWEEMSDHDLMKLHSALSGGIKIEPMTNYRVVPIQTDQRHIKLTNDFFEQMDELGKPIFESFKQEKIDKYLKVFE